MLTLSQKVALDVAASAIGEHDMNAAPSVRLTLFRTGEVWIEAESLELALKRPTKRQPLPTQTILGAGSDVTEALAAFKSGVPRVVLVESWTRNCAGIERSDRVLALAKSGGGLSDGTREEIAYALGHGIYVDIVGDPRPSLAATACSVWDSVEAYISCEHTVPR